MSRISGKDRVDTFHPLQMKGQEIRMTVRRKEIFQHIRGKDKRRIAAGSIRTVAFLCVVDQSRRDEDGVSAL